MDRTGARPVASPVRWGLGDFCWIYLPLPVLALLAKLGGGDTESATDDATALSVAITAGIQYAYWTAGLVFLSFKKGQRSLDADFGVTVQARRMWALLAGVGLQVALGAFVFPITQLLDGEDQAVVEEIRDSSGAKLVVLAIVAGLVAPVLEEILFRGLLLRALRRRLSVEWAIVLSALIFASAHLVDLSLGSLAIMPALFALGLISAYAAVRVGDLSVSIPLHMGFNLLTIALII